MTSTLLSTGLLLFNALMAQGPASDAVLRGASSAAAQADASSAAAVSEEDKKRLEDTKKAAVFFGLDEDVVPEKQRDQLQLAATFFKEQPNLKVTITGHADERGTSEYNMALGERRAKGVKNYLVGLGVDESRIRTVSYGEERPVHEGKDEKSWAANRRVEFEISGELVARAPEQTDTGAKKDDGTDKKDQVAQKDEGKKDDGKGQAGAEKGRRFPWLPIWVGPLVMALAVPALLLAVPFIVSMVYLGWTPLLNGQPATCRPPVTANGFTATGAGPDEWCGSLWAVAFHSQEELPLAGPILGVGIVGTVLTAGAAILTFGVGAVLLVMALLPADESADAAAAARANTTTVP